MKTIRAADLFCGAGGTSTGIYKAAKKLGLGVDLLAVNHWPIAINTHSANHGFARHLCETLDKVNPREVIPRGKLDLLVASPECMHFSNARGGRPRKEQSRASGWHVLRWAEALRVDNILVENVPEFKTWGPLGVDGKPLKSRKGETFKAWVAALESLGYKVEHRILVAADYGDPTTRRRLFVQARRGRKPIRWPRVTHTAEGGATIEGNTEKWKSAREIIDWSHEGTSIFNRKRPLRPKTLRRIAAGLRKFSGIDLEPFLVKLYGTADGQSIDKPCPTVTGGGGHIAVCEPFLTNLRGCSNVRSIDKPCPTVTGGGGHAGVVQPFLLSQQSGGAPRSADKPAPTVAGAGAIGVCNPFLVPFFGEHKGQEPRTHSLDEPAPTVTSHGVGGLVEPCLISVNHGDSGNGSSSGSRAKSVDKPIPTVTGKNGWGVASAFLVQYNGSSKSKSLDLPLGTVTSRDRFALIEIKGEKFLLDIRFRMLKWRELARAQGFEDSYEFHGSGTDITKQIGNAVPVNQAEALAGAILGGM